MKTKQELESAVKAAKADLLKAESALLAFERSPENYRFESLIEGFYLEDDLSGRAAEDCEGSHNVGADEYRQQFYVGDALYTAILYNIEYNRHDKRYYFVDGYKFRVEDAEGNHLKCPDETK